MPDFLVRAYGPHVLLCAVAAVCFASQPAWPDAARAASQEPLRERAAAAAARMWEEDRRQWTFGRDTPEWHDVQARRRQAEGEWRAASEALRAVDAQLGRTHAPVHAGWTRRAALLCLLTFLCYVLTDLLVSPADGLCLLPDGPSYSVLFCVAVPGATASAWTAAAHPCLAWVLFSIADGVALTGLLFDRDAYWHFAQRVRELERLEEARQAELRGGRLGARWEAQQFYEAHRGVLREDFPEALWRASLNAAIPEEAGAVAAWAAARALIEQLQPLVARAGEKRRERAGERGGLLQEIGSLRRHIDKLRASPLDDEDVIEDQVKGSEQRIAELETQLTMLDSPYHEGE